MRSILQPLALYGGIAAAIIGAGGASEQMLPPGLRRAESSPPSVPVAFRRKAARVEMAAGAQQCARQTAP